MHAPMVSKHSGRRWLVAATCALTLGLTACASAPTPADYAKEQPHFSLRDYFNGPVTAQGIFTDRSGKVVKRFSVKMMGRWDGAQGVLEEDFTYSDGSTQRRVWRITDLGGGKWSGKADDIVGEASGESAGNAMNWHYTMALPVDGTVYNVQFNDWLYLMDQRTLLNKAVMSKFGITLGEVTLAFSKP